MRAGIFPSRYAALGLALATLAACAPSRPAAPEALTAVPPAVAKLEQSPLPDPAAGYDWKDAAKKAGFSDRDIERLGRDKVIVGQETFPQVFTPYIDTNRPIFVTSDSLLNAYHVLFEEAVLRWERENARLLPGLLRHLRDQLPSVSGKMTGKPELVSIVGPTAPRMCGS